MKSEFKEVEVEKEIINKFPCVGIIKDEYKPGRSYELAVLFTSKETGVVIHFKKYLISIGTSRTNWETHLFRKMRPGEEIIIKG